MKVFEGLKNIVYKCDLLCSRTLLRVKGEPQFQTLLGGFISISLMILLASLFYSKVIDTLDKIIITSTTTTTSQNDPSSFQLTTIDSGHFMFGVEVWHHDLNIGKRYFDVVLTNTYYEYGRPTNATIQYPLQPCRKDHWDGYPEIQNKFEQLQINYWKCLPKNTNYQIKGKYSSVWSKTLDVALKTCTNNSFDTRPCASEEQISQLFIDNGGPMFFTIYFINPLINAESQTYLSYYLQDSNYIAFSPVGGQESRLFVQDYKIDTDQSILPFTDIDTETGGIVSDSPLKSTYTQVTDTYAVFFFYKSPISNVYSRSFRKLDDVFSYIGGLFGTILIIFFLVSAYNTYKFEINISGYLYSSEKREQKLEKNYNFIYFIGQLIFGFLKKFNSAPNWQKLKYYYQAREEALKQLDVLFLFKRINFLQRSLSVLFTDTQLKGLHLANHTTITEAVTIRKNYKLKPRLKGQIQEIKKKQNGKESFNQFDSNISVQGIKQEKKQTVKQLVSSLHSKDFDSDHYSSQSSFDEGAQNIIDSVIELKKQSHNNPISKQIWTNFDSRLKHLVKPIILKQFSDQEYQTAKEQEQAQQYKIVNLDQQNNPNLFLFIDQNVEAQNDDSLNQNNYVLAKDTFSKLRPLNTKSSSQIPKEK